MRNKEETTFVDIVAWDRLGVKRKATEIVIDNMQMVGSRQNGDSEYADEIPFG